MFFKQFIFAKSAESDAKGEDKPYTLMGALRVIFIPVKAGKCQPSWLYKHLGKLQVPGLVYPLSETCGEETVRGSKSLKWSFQLHRKARQSQFSMYFIFGNKLLEENPSIIIIDCLLCLKLL